MSHIFSHSPLTGRPSDTVSIGVFMSLTADKSIPLLSRLHNDLLCGTSNFERYEPVGDLYGILYPQT